MAREEAICHTGRGDNGLPFTGGCTGTREGNTEAAFEKTREILAALKVAEHPEKSACRFPEHQSSSTHVSLVPPP